MKQIFFFIISISVINFCYSQNNNTQIITFETQEVSSKTTSSGADKKNSLGVGLLSWINGYVPIYFERELTPFLSIQTGVGATFRSFTNDLDQLIWNDGNTSGKFDEYYPYIGLQQYSDVTDSYANYKYRKAGAGVYASFAPKFYPGSNGIDGFSIYPMLEYKLFTSKARLANTSASPNYVASQDVDVYRTNSYQKESFQVLDFTINIGGLYQTSNNFFVEWRFGAGLRDTWGSMLDIGYNNFSNKYENNVRKYSRLKPVVAFDFVVGGLF